MQRSTLRFLGLALAIACVGLGSGVSGWAEDGAKSPQPSAVDFARKIRPILSENCFSCHGFDEKTRKGKLRLDQKDDVLRERDGYHVVKPGDVESSELVQRIVSDDPESVMPPPSSNKKLTPEQVTLLKQWVESGAPWQEHWAFATPVRPAVPDVKAADGAARGAIDRFLQARLEAEGLTQNAEADRHTLVRRLTLDLTGLPPTPAEVEAFVKDGSPDAYEKLVDRLLDSPRYGEHMARYWLDAARYGDTHGLHLDNYREMWPYRDWVIKAFNTNKPYDQFVVEQLAGDLLPNPTTDQIVATGYNRCHVSTAEGGSIEEEVYVRNVTDQIDTNGTVFLGLTVGCARCHDHKYDPIAQKDYYQLFAFFNSIDGKPMDGNASKWPPVVQVPSEEQAARMKQLEESLASLRSKVKEEVAKVTYDATADASLPEYVSREDFVWVDDELPAPATSSEPQGWSFAAAPEVPVLSGSKAVKQSFKELGQQTFEKGRAIQVGEGDTLFAYVWLDPVDPPKEVMLQWNSGEWKHRAYWGENLVAFGADNTTEKVAMGPLPRTGEWVRLEVDAAKVGLKPGTMVSGLAFTQHGGTAYWDKAGLRTWTPQPGRNYDTLTAWIRDQKAKKGEGLPEPIKQAIALERSKRTPEQVKALTDHFVEVAYSGSRSAIAPLQQQIAEVETQKTQLDGQIATTLVWKEMKEAKPAYILDRGEYDRRKDEVKRNTPSFLPPLPADAPKDRLGFARWLVSPEHPLTSRVMVNRMWQQLFGTGIVKTAEDFGSQGEPPSHPELLDWLSVEFRESGWDVKGLLKQMLMSASYRQDSAITPEKLAKDPGNRLYARGPRFRLDAETLRDQAFAVSGLLIERVGGPSVKPPQPSGLWEAVAYTSSNTAKFVADQGVDKVHRRSLYTFWKRTSPPPQMTTFDAPSRESCTVRRERTNTPLQALMLMNEPQFVEASRMLGQRILKEGGSTPEERLRWAFLLVTSRPPRAEELSELTNAYNDLLKHYSEQVEAAKGLIEIGETKADPALAANELAAWTMIGSILLNLDEVVTRG